MSCLTYVLITHGQTMSELTVFIIKSVVGLLCSHTANNSFQSPLEIRLGLRAGWDCQAILGENRTLSPPNLHPAHFASISSLHMYWLISDDFKYKYVYTCKGHLKCLLRPRAIFWHRTSWLTSWSSCSNLTPSGMMLILPRCTILASFKLSNADFIIYLQSSKLELIFEVPTQGNGRLLCVTVNFHCRRAKERNLKILSWCVTHFNEMIEIKTKSERGSELL